jgi:nitrite reductase/ring-hydroxylating ferredoxin subunit
MDTDGWIATLPLDALPEGRSVKTDAGGDQVMLHRSGDTIFAVRNRCTHQGAPLDRGPVKIGGSEATVTCPFHGSTFRLGDGGVMRGPAVEPVQAFETRVTDGVVEVRPREG